MKTLQHNNSDEDLKNNINGKTLLLLESLLTYFSNNINFLNSIISQKETLSLRILDWLVTNYSKKLNIVYKLEINGDVKYFNIYLEYKNQLKAYSKKYFDPFCRRERILINIKDLSWNVLLDTKYKSKQDELITTVGQSNFFRWFIENRVLNYAIENIVDIDRDMINTLNQNKDRIKRKELSKSASKCICTYNNNIIVKF